MAVVSRFGLEGYGVRRAGSFDGKPAPNYTGPVTRLGACGFGAQRAGSFAGKPLTAWVAANDASSAASADVVSLTPHVPVTLTVNDASSAAVAGQPVLVGSEPLTVNDASSAGSPDVVALTGHAPGVPVVSPNDASSAAAADQVALTYRAPVSLVINDASSAASAESVGLTYRAPVSLPVNDASSGATAGLVLLTAYDPSTYRVVPADASSAASTDVVGLSYNDPTTQVDVFDASGDAAADVVGLTFALGVPLVQNPARTIILTRPRDVTASWDFIEPDELDGLTFDISVDVPPGITVTSVHCSCTVASTNIDAAVDASPSARLYAAPTITTAPMVGTGRTRWYVNQMFGNNPVPGNLYHLHIEAHTSDGRIIAGDGHVWCMAPN
jgi:hypothetical protein